MTFKNHCSAQRILAYVHSPPMQMSHKISGLTRYWTNVHQISSRSNFSSTVLTQQSALWPVHPLSN